MERIREALKGFYAAHRLPPDGGAGRAYFFLHLGPVAIPAPNPGFRKRAVLYHDVHHMLTGYNTLIGDGEMLIAGYEIGAGCGRFAIAWVLNLWMLPLAALARPRETFAAFVRGRRCRSLYHEADQAFLDQDVGTLRAHLGLDRAPAAPTVRDRALFTLWCAVASAILLGSAAAPIVLAIWLLR